MRSSQSGGLVTNPQWLGVYGTFYREVAARQVDAWLPREPARVLDLSESPEHIADRAADLGHEMIHVVTDGSSLPFLADASMDAVIAERLSSSLVTESTVAELARVLRAGGRLLVRVDSLLLGMSQLAQQQCWAELSDAPSAEVLLVPSPDGTITRCFWPEELREIISDTGLEVEWIRPRTVLSPAMVQEALTDDPSALPSLVETELTLAQDRADESVGIHLVGSARRPSARPPGHGEC